MAKKYKCFKCGIGFCRRTIHNGMLIDLGSNRKYCTICNPYKPKKTKNKREYRPRKKEKLTNWKSKWSQKKRKLLKVRIIHYLGGKCIACSYNKNYSALIIHHKNPKEKEFNIGGQIYKWEKLEKELKKCVLFCSNCHREKHNPKYNKEEMEKLFKEND